MNFLDKSAEKYVNCLMDELKEQNFKFDKPIAFLLNPPYKNTDENEDVRDEKEIDHKEGYEKPVQAAVAERNG